MKEMRAGLGTIVLTCMGVQGFLFYSWTAASEPDASPPLRSRNSTFDDLPQRPVPEGRFLRWCGADGRFLTATQNERGGITAIWLQGPPGEDTMPLSKTSGGFECDQTGSNLIVTNDGVITIKGMRDPGARILATYRGDQQGGGPSIAISPDLKYAAFDSHFVQMQQDEQPSGMKLVPVAQSKYRMRRSLLWSADSSLLFNMMVVQDDPRVPKDHQEAVQIIDVHSGKDTIAKLPSGAWHEDGVFLPNERKLLLFLRPSQNDIKPDPGSVYACEFASKVCRVLVSDVDQVSFSNDGKIGSVKEVLKDPKRRFNGDSVILPIEFVAEIRNPDGGLAASQRFTRKNHQLDLRVMLSPAGKEAALIWGEWSQATDKYEESGRIVILGSRN